MTFNSSEIVIRIGSGFSLLASRLADILNSAGIISASVWKNLNNLEKISLFLATFLATLIAVTYRWTPGWFFRIHSDWGLAYATLAFAIFAYFLARLVQHQEPVRHSLEGMSALLTSIAIMGAGYWFFYERPGVPKVNVETTTQAWPIEDGLALVRITLSIENVGSTVINFENYKYTESLCESKNSKCVDQRIKVDLGQIAPSPTWHKETKDLISDSRSKSADYYVDSKEFRLSRTYKWPPLARQYWKPEGEIEAGEIERHYFKAIVPCSSGLILASTVRVPKVSPALRQMGKRANNLVWVGQSTSEPIDKCI